MCNKLDITNLCQELTENNKKELISIAKHCGFPNYSELTKKELCEQLANYLVNLKDPSVEDYKSRSKQLLRFKRSARPYTSMYTLSTGTDCSAHKLYLPVVRYAGLYYGNAPRDYTGTFYFYEPDSCSLLDLGNVLIAGSKYDAFKKLWYQGGDMILRNPKYIDDALKSYEYNLKILQKPFARETEPGIYYRLHDFPVNPKTDEDLKFIYTNLTADERKDYDPISGIINSFNNLPVGKIHTVVDYKDVEQQPISNETLFAFEPQILYQKVAINPIGEDKYGRYLGIYNFGKFDKMDISLFWMAKSLHYDTVLLQHEYGEIRSITEILDVRPRHISYESICRIADCNLQFGSDDHPLIWLPRYGFVEYDPVRDTFYQKNI